MSEPTGDRADDAPDIIERLERELGRPICGVNTSSGLPCKRWPISEEHGRCSVHAPAASPESQPPVQDPDPVATDEDPPEAEPIGSKLLKVLGIAFLVVLGVALGVGATWWFAPDPPDASSPGPAETPRTSSADVSAGTAAARPVRSDSPPAAEPPPPEPFAMDYRHPDFSLLHRRYSQRTADRVLVTLDRIHQQARRADDRGEALYLQYVILQQQEQYAQSLGKAEDFLNQFNKHSRRAEVLYGAWLLCDQYLDRPERAREYQRMLKGEFPESKWSKSMPPP